MTALHPTDAAVFDAAEEERLRALGGGLWAVRVRGLYVPDETFWFQGNQPEDAAAEQADCLRGAEGSFRARHKGFNGTTLGLVVERRPVYAEAVS